MRSFLKGHDKKSHSHHNEQENYDNIDDVDEVDDGNRNIILAIITQLRPGADLSRITLPTFILERKSMLERITNLMQHPQELIRAAEAPTPEARFVEVVRWYMSGWHIAPKAVKKPLNPILGEYFSCWWDLEDGTQAYYVAEQTSHHPPKSSYFYIIPEHGIRADGLLLPYSRFLGNSAASIMEGIGYLTFENHDEAYSITQPNIYARNILLGSLKLEMGDHAIVECKKTGMKLDIEFKVKGFISGTWHAVEGNITKNGQALYEITGKWNEVLNIKDLRTGKSEVFFDTTKDRGVPPKVRPISEQGEHESRRLWRHVTDALGNRDHNTATTEKAKIEDEQRALRSERSHGIIPEHHDRLFKPIDGNLQYIIGIDELLKKTPPEKRGELLRKYVPILPGDKFPEDFSKPVPEKVANLASGGTSSEPAEDDEFVDAEETI